MTDAILGTRAVLSALDGEVEVEVKPGTQSTEVITIKDRGVTRLRGNGRGDLRVGIQVVTPTKLSSKEQELMRQFAGSRKQPAPHFAQFQQGLFAKLRDRFLGL
jgi:molecular chaperone DnaJ